MAAAKGRKRGKKVVETAPPEDIVAQLFVALGQGSGALSFSPSGVSVARKYYMARIEKFAEQWNDDAPLMLMQARAMGRIASDIACAEGAYTVHKIHFMRAMKRFETYQKEKSYWPAICRWCE